MKLNGFTYLLLSTVLLVASACSDLNKGKQLQTLQKLETSLAEAETQNRKVNRKEITEIQSYFAYHLKRIGDSLEGKEIQKETAHFLDSCKFLLHEIKQINQQNAFIDSSIPTTQKRIGALKHDIQEQTGNRKMYAEYLEMESTNVEHIATVSKDLKKSSAEIKELAERLARRLQDLTIHFKRP